MPSHVGHPFDGSHVHSWRYRCCQSLYKSLGLLGVIEHTHHFTQISDTSTEVDQKVLILKTWMIF